MTLSAVALVLTAICLAAGDEPAALRSSKKSVALPAPKTAANAPAKPAASAQAKAATESTPTEPVDDSSNEEAIRETGETFVKAYERGDAKAVAAHFTADAEYIDEQGNLSQGRQEIEELLNALFSKNSDSTLELTIESIRFLGPGVAIEDGSATVTRAAGNPSDYSRYTAVHVKTDGKWLMASCREHTPKDLRQHAAQLAQLDWLLGDWVDEADDSVVEFACLAVDKGNFLLREFTVKIAGQAAMSGSQRIGWDPVTGKLRVWTFDSEGGYGEGTWQHNGDLWALKSAGVTADGQPASNTFLFKVLNAHTISWQAIDREVGGVSLPDTDEYILVLAPPKPDSTETPVAKN